MGDCSAQGQARGKYAPSLPAMHPFGQNLTFCLARLRRPCNRVSPWENGKRGGKRAFVFPSAKSAGWAPVPAGEETAAVCPLPQLPVCLELEQLSTPFPISDWFQIPQPTSAPSKLSSSQEGPGKGWDLPSHFCSNSKQRAISKGNEDPNDSQGRGKPMGFKGKRQCFRLLPSSVDLTSFHQHFCWRTHKAVFKASGPHRELVSSFRSPLVLVWDRGLL